jgi:hypothetical protein
MKRSDHTVDLAQRGRRVVVGAAAVVAVFGAAAGPSVWRADAAGPIVQTVVVPGSGGPTPASVPVVFRWSADKFLAVIRFDRRPVTRASSSYFASGSLNGYVQNPGGALSFLRRNGRARCYLVSFTGEPPRREGTSRWHFPGSLPLLDRLGRRDVVSVRMQAYGADPADDALGESYLGGPAVRYDNVPVRVARGPLRSRFGRSGLNNRNAQRYLRRIGCAGQMEPLGYTGSRKKHRRS